MHELKTYLELSEKVKADAALMQLLRCGVGAVAMVHERVRVQHGER